MGVARHGWMAVIVAACIFVIASAQSAGAAWLPGKDRGLAINSINYIRVRGSFDRTGDLTDGTRFSKYEAANYSIYGLTDWLAVGLEPTLTRITSQSGADEETESGFSKISMFTRLRLIRGTTWTVSSQFLGRYADQGGRGTLSRPGPDAEVRLLFGNSTTVLNRSAFEVVEVAYRRRFGVGAAEVRADVTWGIRFLPRWDLLVQSFNIIAVGAGPGGPSDAFDIAKAHLSTVYHLNGRYSVQIGGRFEYAGRNVSRGAGAFGALWVRF